MTVVSSDKDLENLTLTFVAEFDAPQERVWQGWGDPRHHEGRGGPPPFPAAFDEHDLRPGGTSKYYMTGRAGERAGGGWNVVAVDKPNSFSFEDWFADDDGNPVDSMPVTQGTVTLEDLGGRTRMTTVSRFASQIGRAHVWNPVTPISRMPSSA